MLSNLNFVLFIYIFFSFLSQFGRWTKWHEDDIGETCLQVDIFSTSDEHCFVLYKRYGWVACVMGWHDFRGMEDLCLFLYLAFFNSADSILLLNDFLLLAITYLFYLSVLLCFAIVTLYFMLMLTLGLLIIFLLAYCICVSHFVYSKSICFVLSL